MIAAPDRDCPRCPRLVAYRSANRAANPGWHNAPVASWGPTDAPLRQGMETLRSTFAEYLIAIRKGRLAAKDYETLGAKVDSEVGNIVAQCKLEPKADAMLHLVVADLLNAAAVMRGKAPGKPAAAARQAVHAVNNYGRYFDHPQWQPLG